MATYFFHLYNDVCTLDDVGSEFANDAAALAAARKYSLNMACHSVAILGHLTLHHRVEVRDTAGALVANVTFGEVVDVRP